MKGWHEFQRTSQWRRRRESRRFCQPNGGRNRVVPPKLSNERALRISLSAREEFARRGFAGARVEQIARRAGVNKQLLFYYYHSKRGLFQAVLAEAASELEAALSKLTFPTGEHR